jgi:anti-anti-sigma regulatory factor
VVGAALDALPFAALRSVASRDLEIPEPATIGAFDSGSPAVHVWGPVMVVPYAGDETAVAVEAVALDPSAAGVTVVVVDLQGAIVDDGFGAVALERVVDVIQGQGAEAVITGVSPLSARVVAGLGHGPLVVRKDLGDAIAAAFQIAELQRHAV